MSNLGERLRFHVRREQARERLAQIRYVILRHERIGGDDRAEVDRALGGFHNFVNRVLELLMEGEVRGLARDLAAHVAERGGVGGAVDVVRADHDVADRERRIDPAGRADGDNHARLKFAHHPAEQGRRGHHAHASGDEQDRRTALARGLRLARGDVARGEREIGKELAEGLHFLIHRRNDDGVNGAHA